MNSKLQPYPWLENTWDILLKMDAKNRFAHAILLAGPQGLGKEALAQAFIARQLCQNPTNLACGFCSACHLFLSGNHPDYFLIKPHEAEHSIKIDEIRVLITKLNYSAHQKQGKFCLISPAEAMTENAANALLKIVEEPPPQTYFILISHEPGVLKATIRSRCQFLLARATSSQKEMETFLEKPYSQTAIFLALTDNAPLKARALMQNQAFGDFWRDLFAVLQFEMDLIDFISIYGSMPETLDWLCAFLESCLRLLAAYPANAILCPPDFEKKFLLLGQKWDIDTVFSCLDLVYVARGAKLQGLNLNPEFQLIEILKKMLYFLL